MESSIIPVITLWEEFSSKNKKAGVKEFAHWVLKNEGPDKEVDLPETSYNPIKTNAFKEESELDDSAKVMLLIARLQRFMQMKAKPVINKLGFTKGHEYAMLTHVYLLKSPNKKELARQMLLENSTAVEITNRLLKKGFVKEVPDDADKRSTRISLTQKGEQILLESYTYMQQLPANFLDCLNAAEIKELLLLLQKVEKYQAASF